VGTRNQSDNLQDGSHHHATVDQTGGQNFSHLDQANTDNRSTVTQVRADPAGASNQSRITQGNIEVSSGAGNRVSVSQNGNNLYSIISQVGGGQNATTTQAGAPGDKNSATVVQTGSGSNSDISQSAAGNVAVVKMSGGGANDNSGTRENSSVIRQTNTVFVAGTSGGMVAGKPDTFNNPTTGNNADIDITGTWNSSTLQQDGIGNRAVVKMFGGGGGTSVAGPGPNDTNTPGGRSAGNSSDAYQRGSNNYVEMKSGAAHRGLVGNGLGNIATVRQGSPTSSVLATNNTALVYQYGIMDVVNITQENNQLGPGGADQGGSFADISTVGTNSTVTVVQVGTNEAVVTLAVNGDGTGGQNQIGINQTDAGDAAGGSASRNRGLVSQYGIGNATDIQQNAINAAALVWQQRGSRNNAATIHQGTGATNAALGTTGGTGSNAQNLIVDVTQSGRGSTARARQDGETLSLLLSQSGTARTTNGVAVDSVNIVEVWQINRLQSGTVTQSGFNLSASVEQRGNNAATGLRNLVSLQQTGDRHSATARQTATVGATPECSPASACPSAGSSGDANARAAGTRYSAEIRIIQHGSTSGTTAPANVGNSATVEQRGLGQYAEINQQGRGNVAGILQGVNATNAVAIIRQTGDGNTFFITQASAGQYLHIQQTGSNNAVTSTVATANGGGATSSGPGAVQPSL
jgi:hypothetical protein